MSNEAVIEFLRFTCPRCSSALRAPASRAGEHLDCPACQAGLLAPTDCGPDGTIQADCAAAPRATRHASRSAPSTPLKPSRAAVAVVCAVLVLLGAGALIGNSIANGIERARIERHVKALVENGDGAFLASDVNAAAEQATQALQALDDSPQQLHPEMVRKWKARCEHFLFTKCEADKLQTMFEQAGTDLQTARNRLENNKSLLGPPTAENLPLVSRVEGLLLRVAELELKQKQQRLNEELQAAESLYKDGKIEEAASRGLDIGRQLVGKPAVQDPGVEKRLGVLRQRGEQLKEAKDVRLAARGSTYAEAKRKLQARLDALDGNNRDLKPLSQRIEALKNELLQEERSSRKLDDKESVLVQAFVKALAGNDKNITGGQVEGDGIQLSYNGKPLRMGLEPSAPAGRIFLEAAGQRFLIQAAEMFGSRGGDGSPRQPPRPAANLTHVLALGEAMKQAGVPAGETWNAGVEAPLPSARRLGSDGQEYVFLGDRLYVGKPLQEADSGKQARQDFEEKTEALAVAVENDGPTPEDIRRVVAVAVRAAYKDAPWWDQLPGGFVRKVLNEDYIESNLPGSAERLKKPLADFRAAYARISTPRERFRGASSQGDEAQELQTFEKRAIWRIHNQAAATTTFAIRNPDSDRGRLFILYDFPGSPAEFPGAGQSKTVRMTHQALGVTATYDMAENKFTCDQGVWDRGVVLESSAIPENWRILKGLGPPAWCLPPHVLLMDMLGDVKGLATPYGRLDVRNFNEIADPARREQAMNAFLDQMAKVLPTANYLHLYFRYFSEYSWPSPITTRPNLLGCRAHCGGYSAQSAFYTLQRFMGGRTVGDCVDLAELFMVVTRRQHKLSYVMSLPQHAACGWVEKPPQGQGYTFYLLETGPARMFTDKDLDAVIEKAYRAYDDTKTMHIDPKSLGFLFRFAGEPSRTPYWLSSRMYVDPVYGETMERVQSYWHFHFYALGIKTMTEMIEKGDRAPENCTELAGLYHYVREAESSVHWTEEALKQLTSEQRTTRLGEKLRIATVWHDVRENQKCYDVLRDVAAELKGLERDPKGLDYLNLRLQAMGILAALGRPWEAWDVVASDMLHLKQNRLVKIEHATGLTAVYARMQRQIREGKQTTPEEKEKLGKIQEVLRWFYERALFEPKDLFNDIMRKYASLGLWYAGQYGQERLVAELLKGGPFPDPAQPRVHANRKDPEAEDWKWIRLSLPCYYMAIADALPLDEPSENWRREEAIKLTDAMLKAASEARKFGSLYMTEFQLLEERLLRAFLVKDWSELEAVLIETQERDWPQLTKGIAETFGRSSRFVTPDEFVAQYRVFARHIQPRTAYFAAIYAAYRADGIEHAVRAAQVAVERWPGDQDMKREAQYLEELARKKQAKTKG